MSKKYTKVTLADNKTSVCPVCFKTNRHTTGQVCEHVSKVTVKGIVFYRNA